MFTLGVNCRLIHWNLIQPSVGNYFGVFVLCSFYFF